MCTVGRRWRIYPTSIFLSIIQRWLVTHLAFENLFVGLPKVFGEKCVYNGVHRRIAVSQAVCSYSEEKGGLSQWENSKFGPEMNHMVRQPGDAKNHHHHQHSLCCLRQGKENTDVWWALEESALNPLQKHYFIGFFLKKGIMRENALWNIYYWFYSITYTGFILHIELPQGEP